MPETAIFKSKQQPFPHYEGGHGVAYRIEIDLTIPQRPMQRHIWIMADGSEQVEDWIASLHETPENLLSRGYERAA